MFNRISTMAFDILRDKNSKKFTLTKLVTVIFTLVLMAQLTISTIIMYQNSHVDHMLIGEVMAFVASLLGLKNFRKEVRLEDGKDTAEKLKKDNDNSLDDSAVLPQFHPDYKG